MLQKRLTNLNDQQYNLSMKANYLTSVSTVQLLFSGEGAQTASAGTLPSSDYMFYVSVFTLRAIES